MSGFKSPSSNGVVSVDGRTGVVDLTGLYLPYLQGLTAGGVVDNTSVINAAIVAANAAGGGTIYLPAGTFAHTGLTMKSGVLLRGSGELATILINTSAATPSISAVGAGGGGEATFVGDWEVSDLQLTRSSIATGSHGITMFVSHRYVVSHVLITNHDHGVHEKLSWNSEWRSVTSKLNNYGWYVEGSTIAGIPNTRVACRFKQNGTGIFCENDLDTVTWIGCDITDNTAAGVTIRGNRTKNWMFTGCNFEFNAGNDILIGDDATTPTHVEVLNCRFARAVLASDIAIWAKAGTRLTTENCKFINYDIGIQRETAYGRSEHRSDSVDTCNVYYRIRTVSGSDITSPPAWLAGSNAGQTRQTDSAFNFGTTADTNLFRQAANLLQTSDDFALGLAGMGLQVKEGSNAKMGTATLVGGAAVVSTTAVTANSRVLLTIQSLGTVAVAKAIAVTARTAGTSFTITSADGTDTSVIAWMLVEPAA